MSVGKRKDVAPDSGRDEFTEGGEAREIAEAWIPQRKGEALLGKLRRVTDIVTKISRAGEKAPIAEFSPVVVRGASGDVEAFGSLALMLSASLRLRINASDVGRVFGIVYEGDVESGKGNPMHVYTVVEHKSPERLVAALRKAGWDGAGDDLPF